LVGLNGTAENITLPTCEVAAGTRNELPVFLRPAVAVGGLINKATNFISENVSQQDAQSFAFSGATAFARGYVAEADLSKETKIKVTVALEVAQAAVSGGTSLLTKGLGLVAHALDRVAPGLGKGASQALSDVATAYTPGAALAGQVAGEILGKFTGRVVREQLAAQQDAGIKR
jgi:hypothetical protein